MMWGRCDPQALQDYLDGTLDDRECQRVERHALRCARCRERIETELAGFSREFARACVDGQAPDIRRSILMAAQPGRNRVGWTVLKAATVATVCMALFVVVRPEKLHVEPMRGAIVVNGKRSSDGDTLPENAEVVFIGGGRVSLRGLQAESRDALSRIRVRRVAGGWSIDVLSGRIVFNKERPSPRLVAKAGGREFRPIGTRFGVTVSYGELPTLDVYRDHVLVKGVRDAVVSEGRSLVGNVEGLVGDDPTAFCANPPYLGRKLGSAVATGLPSMEAAPMPTEVVQALVEAEREAWRSPGDPLPLARAARLLAEQAEPASATSAMGEALDRDLDLSGCPDGLLWQGLREIAAYNAASDVSDRILDALSRRGAASREYLAAWKHLVGTMRDPSASDSMRVSAGYRLWRHGLQEDRAVVARALVAQMYPFTMGEKSIRDALALFRALADDYRRRGSRRLYARALSEVAEAMFRLNTESPESLEPLREAIALWPRARWKANYAARCAELSSVDPTTLRLMGEAILEEPCAEVFERAGVLLSISAATEADWEDFGEFLRRRAEAFKNVPLALAQTAHFLSLHDPEAGMRWMDRAKKIAYRDGVPDGSPIPGYAAIVRWRYEDGGKTVSDQRALEIARLEGLFDGTRFDRNAAHFLLCAGAYETALLALQQHPWTEMNDRAQLEGECLLKLGRPREAMRVLARGIRAEKARFPRSILLAELEVLYAEALARAEPAKARLLAAQLVEKTLPNYKAGWFVTTLRRQSLEARARAVLGDYRRALELFEPYAKPWRANTFISEARRHLESMRAQAERAR